MSSDNKKNASASGSRNKTDRDVSGRYNTMVQSLLDIWNVLAAAEKPLTAKEVGNRIKAKDKNTSPRTVERRLEEAVDLINAVFPQTVLHTEDDPAILHTYPYDGALHVVVENSVGDVKWDGNMHAVFHESTVNPVPQPTLNRKLPEMAVDYDDMKVAVKRQKKILDRSAPPDPRDKENFLFMEDYPPLSLAAVVEVKGKNEKKVALSALNYERQQDKLPPDARNSKTPTRKFYLQSILAPEEWQMLSDMILVYPYISDRETNKLLSAMNRIAPGSRKWSKLIQAPKNPNAVRFDFIRKLEDAIQNRHKVGIEYGRYQLAGKAGVWSPKLQADGHGYYAASPYALTWANGYYYLVCSIEKKGKDGKVTQEMRNFRVDRILNIKDSTLPFEKPEAFNVHKYRDRSPVMYPGEVVSIELRCHIGMLSILMDFFGSAISEYSAPQNDYTTVKLEASENGTRLFALQYADRVEVLKPRSLRDEVASTLRAAAQKYL